MASTGGGRGEPRAGPAPRHSLFLLYLKEGRHSSGLAVCGDMGEPAHPGVSVVFWRGRISLALLVLLPGLPGFSRSIHRPWEMVTSWFLAAFSCLPPNPFVQDGFCFCQCPSSLPVAIDHRIWTGVGVGVESIWDPSDLLSWLCVSMGLGGGGGGELLL